MKAEWTLASAGMDSRPSTASAWATLCALLAILPSAVGLAVHHWDTSLPLAGESATACREYGLPVCRP